MFNKHEFIVDNDFEVLKFEGKGSWTYVIIDNPFSEKRNKFGWLQVSGFVDSYELKRYKLMPIKGNKLFLPLKAELRKKIKKNEGDIVSVKLYLDESLTEIPKEIIEVLEFEPKASDFFNSLSDSEKQFYIKWIIDAKSEDTKIKRIVSMIRNLEARNKFYFKKNLD